MVSQPGVSLRILLAMTPFSETVAFFRRRLKTTIFLRALVPAFDFLHAIADAAHENLLVGRMELDTAVSV